MTEKNWFALVERLQAWRETIVLPRWVIDDVKDLVRENARLRELVDKQRTVVDGVIEFHDVLANWSKAYPTDIFPEPPPGQHGKTVDGCSTAMGRHVTKRLLEDLNSLVMNKVATLEQEEQQGG